MLADICCEALPPATEKTKLMEIKTQKQINSLRFENLTPKEKAELYHKLALITADLQIALKNARDESGLSLVDISNSIKKTLGPEDSKILAGNLLK